MKNRQERKLLTRQSLMNAALEWVEEGQHFSSLSIREVAKRAGVVPTAFYRHFKDLDDLALNLVDELSLVLRQLMREARQNRGAPGNIIRDSVTQFCDYVVSQRVFFLFMAQSMTGGSGVIRQAVRSELQFFAKELVSDLQRLNLFTHYHYTYLLIALTLHLMGRRTTRPFPNSSSSSSSCSCSCSVLFSCNSLLSRAYYHSCCADY